MLGQMKQINISAMGCFLNIMSQSTFIFVLLIIQLFRIKAKFVEPSVAMNMHMNHIPDPRDRSCWHKYSEIVNPVSSNAFVFIDEHEGSIDNARLQ